ncbi:uncharacterized protein EV420DRAFT_1487436 [Desarmillaria tabescens]|uniref:Uncharacterized protein n=1 Tax=Armillaria tabescens TaxID=1929756 RepID=A0AA39MKA1_ARMTA|nr:uncharacterized protein EV420DRAFT_1487436 [Desarmillaria tabescens]KAK0436819.1 hypothetical protein EV420DRAFT_1487436 [Desarmillaria tabescens]
MEVGVWALVWGFKHRLKDKVAAVEDFTGMFLVYSTPQHSTGVKSVWQAIERSWFLPTLNVNMKRRDHPNLLSEIPDEKQDVLILVAILKVQGSFQSSPESILKVQEGFESPECCHNRVLKAKIQEFPELVTKASVQGKVSADGKPKVCGVPERMPRPLVPVPTSSILKLGFGTPFRLRTPQTLVSALPNMDTEIKYSRRDFGSTHIFGAGLAKISTETDAFGIDSG